MLVTVCLCVCCHPIYSGRQTWTHQPGLHKRKVTQDFSNFLLRCLPLLLSREGLPAHCAHVKRPTRVQLPVLQPTNARLTPGRETAFLENSEDRCKRHTARIGTVSVTNAVTFKRTSADTRVGAIEHPQTSYPRIMMDWGASPLRETQTRPRPLQRKVPTKVNSLHRAYFCRGE